MSQKSEAFYMLNTVKHVTLQLLFKKSYFYLILYI